jgi:hypothetical protein
VLINTAIFLSSEFFLINVIAAANQGANLLLVAVIHITVYTGDGLKARDTANWNDESTMSFVYIPLRGKVLINHECSKQIGVKHNNFVDFTTAFLESFALAHAACTAC